MKKIKKIKIKLNGVLKSINENEKLSIIIDNLKIPVKKTFTVCLKSKRAIAKCMAPAFNFAIADFRKLGSNPGPDRNHPW